MPFELLYLQGIQQVVFATPWMIAFMIFLARWLILANVFIALSLILTKRPLAKRIVAEAIWSALVALLLTKLIGTVIGRDRPFLATEELILLIPPPFNTSFPSGHTATASAMAFAFLAGRRTAGLISFVVAAFVAFGRMAVGVHYPSDIVGGILVGGFSFLIIHLISKRLRSRDLNAAAERHHHV
ncbi:phosphatase PAP2 family protein [Patescibacteria group bacterium]|jgi:undecaprenyl-diphosphatase|nr:phosphatase PAP2 family protein [Patescibacteria group bacterium]